MNATFTIMHKLIPSKRQVGLTVILFAAAFFPKINFAQRFNHNGGDRNFGNNPQQVQTPSRQPQTVQERQPQNSFRQSAPVQDRQPQYRQSQQGTAPQQQAFRQIQAVPERQPQYRQPLQEQPHSNLQQYQQHTVYAPPRSIDPPTVNQDHTGYQNRNSNGYGQAGNRGDNGSGNYNYRNQGSGFRDRDGMRGNRAYNNYDRDNHRDYYRGNGSYTRNVWGSSWHPVGYFLSGLTANAIRLSFGNGYYYYSDGCYYRPYNGGYTVVAPIMGSIVSYLPDGYETVQVGNEYYYYYGGDFYIDNGRGYLLVQAPVGAVVSQVPSDAIEVNIYGRYLLQYNNTYFEPFNQQGQDLYEVVRPN